ncbi:uncharacterized protein PV09_08064 [Verruconis gallopava]|uniref:Rhodopsin domain-containing protein n=1 Tax=Verruconis gallopava TaxID=253628 RepID=A0A0D1YHM0_9PEZI|nr:uncharacterized protein PV09_08064 [Verruconis gallopava]KIW00352.1 hypothetical protein PV09_08064 [Verruconis gallopava]
MKHPAVEQYTPRAEGQQGGLLAASTRFQDGMKPPSPGDRSDFRATIVVSAAVLMMCSTVAVTFRLVRSWQKLRKFQLHDLFIFLAYVCAVVMSANCALLTTRGLGWHDFDGSIATSESFQATVITINCFYFTCNLCVKLCLLQLYRAFTRNLWGTVLICFMELASILFWLGSFLATVFECVPLAAIWDWTITEGWCIDVVLFYHANASIMIAMDCVLYLIPILFTWNLQLSRQKRVGIVVLFGLGFIVVGSSCYRLWVIHEVIRNGDMSYNYGRSLFASALENHTAIVIACAPAMRSVVGRGLYPRVKTAVSSGRDKFGKMWSSSSHSAPSTPLVDRFQISSPCGTPSASSKGGAAFANGPSLQSMPLTKPSPVVGYSRSFSTGEDDDVELDFRNPTCEVAPAVTTTVTADDASLRPPSSRSRIYITREITVTEELVPPPSIPATGRDDVASKCVSRPCMDSVTNLAGCLPLDLTASSLTRGHGSGM